MESQGGIAAMGYRLCGKKDKEGIHVGDYMENFNEVRKEAKEIGCKNIELAKKYNQKF